MATPAAKFYGISLSFSLLGLFLLLSPLQTKIRQGKHCLSAQGLIREVARQREGVIEVYFRHLLKSILGVESGGFEDGVTCEILALDSSYQGLVGEIRCFDFVDGLDGLSEN